MASPIRCESLTKRYGAKTAVDGLTLEVPAGEVFGFIGPNGAGKTTTIRLLLDLIRPTAGHAFLFGEKVRGGGARLRHRVGYLSGELSLYEHLTGRELVSFLAHLRGGAHWRWTTDLAERLDLDLDRRIAVLSRGNKQKVGLVQALAHRPPLAILDEPTTGLDPLIQHVVYGFVDLLREQGVTVFFSSHVLSEVDRVADRVGMIRGGQLLVVDSVEALRERARRRVDVRFAGPPPSDAFERVAGVRETSVEGALARFSVEGSIDSLLKALAQYEVLSLESHEADLEDVFLDLYAPGN